MQSGVLGAVLAGGRSRRMGRDKASLILLGRPLVIHAAEILRQVVAEVVVVGGRQAGEPGLELVRDVHRGCGPLGGLHAALHRAAGSPVLVLACDLPLVSPELLRHLLAEAAGSGARACAVSLAGRLQPLCGVYGAACLELAERRLQQGMLSAHGFFEALGGRAVALTPDLPFYDPELLLNVNRPQELDTARSRLAAVSRRD